MQEIRQIHLICRIQSGESDITLINRFLISICYNIAKPETNYICDIYGFAGAADRPRAEGQ